MSMNIIATQRVLNNQAPSAQGIILSVMQGHYFAFQLREYRQVKHFLDGRNALYFRMVIMLLKGVYLTC